MLLPKNLEVKTIESNQSFDIHLKDVPWMLGEIKVGSQVTWGMYDYKNKDLELSDVIEVETTRKAIIHNKDCIELKTMEYYLTSTVQNTIHDYVRVDSHTFQMIASSYENNGTFHFESIHDKKYFESSGDVGRRNYKMNEISITKNIIDTSSLDINDGEKVYEVTVNGKTQECLRIIQRNQKVPNHLEELFVNKDGYLILFSKYLSEKAIDLEDKEWLENRFEEKYLIMSGVKYYHWFYCISNRSIN